MKTKYVQPLLKFSLIAFLLSVLFFQCSSSKENVKQNEKLNTDDVKNMVNNKEFIFVADRVNPLRGRSRYLTSEYDVKINKDSLVSFLPYFGRAYQAPVNPSEGGIQFTSAEFSYQINAVKNNGWYVIIKPKDYQQIQQFSFRIFENGNASLDVTSTYKDPISFQGNVEKIVK